jgi:hypothetical protein
MLIENVRERGSRPCEVLSSVWPMPKKLLAGGAAVWLEDLEIAAQSKDADVTIGKLRYEAQFIMVKHP